MARFMVSNGDSLLPESSVVVSVPDTWLMPSKPLAAAVPESKSCRRTTQ